MVPEGWRKVALGDVARIGTGATPSRGRPEYWQGGNVPWVSSGKVNDFLITEPSALITERALAECSLELLPAGTILVGIIGQGKTRGTVARLGISACVNQNAAYVLPTAADSGFVFAYLRHQYARLRSSGHGSNQDALNGEILKQYPLPLPPPPEQRAIAALLGTWDRAIEQTNRLIEAKRRMRSSLRQKLLRRPSQPTVPWPVRRLGSLFRSVRRKNTGGLDLVLTASGNDGLVDQKTFFNRRVAAEDVSGYYLLHRGEFAYNRSAMESYPFGAIKRLDRYDAGAVSTLYLCFAPSDASVCSDFYRHYFDADLLAPALREITQVGGRAHGLLNVTKTDFFQIGVPHPPLPVQQRIAAVLNSAAEELGHLSSLLDALQQQKRALADKLLTGQLRLSVPEES